MNTDPAKRCTSYGWRFCLISIVNLAIFGLSCSAPANDSTQTADPVQWGAMQGGLQSKIYADQPAFSAADPILVHYSIRNASNEPKKVWHNGFWPSNRIDVTDPTGHPAAFTRKGDANRKAFGGPVEKNFPVTLQPGQTDEDFPVLNLRDYLVMDAPGEYSVQYTYQQDIGPVISNPLKIIVTK